MKSDNIVKSIKVSFTVILFICPLLIAYNIVNSTFNPKFSHTVDLTREDSGNREDRGEIDDTNESAEITLFNALQTNSTESYYTRYCFDTEILFNIGFAVMLAFMWNMTDAMKIGVL